MKTRLNHKPISQSRGATRHRSGNSTESGRRPHSPALAILHVGVGASLQKGLCDLGHLRHHVRGMFLWTVQRHKVQRGLLGTRRGGIDKGPVLNEERGSKEISLKRDNRKTVTQDKGRAGCPCQCFRGKSGTQTGRGTGLVSRTLGRLQVETRRQDHGVTRFSL